MLTKVCNLNEITTALPGNSRRFTIDEMNPIWVDLGKVMVARVFDGNLVVQSGDEMSFDHKAKFIELYWEANLCIATLFTDEVKSKLQLCLGGVTETSREFKDNGGEIPFINERKALTSEFNNAKENESWN